MKGLTKILLALGVGGGALLLLSKTTGLLNFMRLLTITPQLDGGLKAINFKSSNLNIPIKVDFGNRTDQEIAISVSSVILYFREKQIGQTKPTTTQVKISQHSTSSLKGLIIQIPLLSLVQVAGTAIATLISSGVSPHLFRT